MSDTDHHEEDAPRYDDINTPVIVLTGAIAAVVTLLTIFFVQGLCYHWQNSYLSSQNTRPTSQSAVDTINDQKSMLTGDQTKLTIDEAMSAVVAKYKN